MDMKLSKKEVKERYGEATIGPAKPDEGPHYPGGLTISLDKESLSKLDISPKDFKADEPVEIKINKAHIKSLTSSEGDTYDSTNITIQVTDMDIKKKGKFAQAHEQKNRGPGE